MSWGQFFVIFIWGIGVGIVIGECLYAQKTDNAPEYPADPKIYTFPNNTKK